MPNLAGAKRKTEQAASDLKKKREDLRKVLDNAAKLHGKIEGRPTTPPDKNLKEWNRELQKANKALNEVAKALQTLANVTNGYHQSRLQEAASQNS